MVVKSLGNEVINSSTGDSISCQNPFSVSRAYEFHSIHSKKLLKPGDRQNQLKNYISTADPNVIYYASTYEVYSLNVSSRKRTLIKSLPWKPFCLDAAHGWICVGGDENGQCAFISIDENAPGENTSQPQLEVDDLLPIDLDPEYRHIRHDPRRAPRWPGFCSGPIYELQYHDLGAERVNSVKIHLLADTDKGSGNEVVVVIS